ncbi:Copine-8 [Holothuria leucospilota]|uniref:Copine-3 n=1 Tax=Holothuria leucospilota TaxID=206669 RepID=A0A9Q1CM27_HOLLE|nr:Copine-8 [Holothuria leucospilota]
MADSSVLPPGVFQPGTAAVPATRVEITVSCRLIWLRGTECLHAFIPLPPVFGQGFLCFVNILCVLYTTRLGSNQFAEYERTEQIKNSLNPDFVHKYILTYYFEERQRLKFEIYDVDSPRSKLDAHDFLGSLETTLGEILGSMNNRLEKPLVNGKGGKIILTAEEVSDCKDQATLTFRGLKLDKKDFLGKSDPFLVFYRCNEDNSYTIVHRTEVKKNTLNPSWRPFILLVRALCNGDYDRSIKIECYDWDNDGSSHDLIGECYTNMRQLAEGSGSFEVDFEFFLLTNTIGNPSHSNSLHYINPYQPNHYEQAIGAVGEVIQDYDSDKLFPVLGFGAKIPPDGRVSHEFPVNFNPVNPFCIGIHGIMQAYKACIQQVQLYGPTNFSPIINHVARFAHAYPDGSNYFILLIITDGVISDMEMTKQSIIAASGLPLSIIIVGVGPADFDAMEELDSDKHLLTFRGRTAERDIVQFVPFRDYVGGIGSGNSQLSQARLAKDVLAEVPEQLISFMKKKGVVPNEQPAAAHKSLTDVVATAPPM